MNTSLHSFFKKRNKAFFVLSTALFWKTTRGFSVFPGQSLVSSSFPLAPTMSTPTKKRCLSKHRFLPNTFALYTSSVDAYSCDKLVDQFTDDMWEEYRILVQDIMARDRVIKKVQADVLPSVQDFLLSRSISSIPNLSAESMHDFRQTSRIYYKDFCETKGWNKVQSEYLERCLSYTADWCAKKQFIVPAMIAWLKMRETGFVPRENTVSTFLFVLGLRPEDVLPQMVLSDVATFHDACYNPNEKTVFLRIKSLIASGHAQEAEDLLQAIPNCQKLRTFSPLVNHYCQMDKDVPHTLRILRHMRESPGVYMDVDTYVTILTSVAEQGYFNSNVSIQPNEMMIEAGFTVTGPALFDAIAQEMAQDILEFNETSAITLYSALDSALRASPKEETELTQLPAASEVTSQSTPSTVLGRVTVDHSTCICPATKAKLQLFSLTKDQRESVRDTLLEMASAQHQEFATKMKSRGKIRQDPASSSGEYALNELQKFADWVAEKNFTAIIDGPNIAYFGHAVLHYSQVARMVEYLESLGEVPLVTMPYKYCQPKFYVASINQEQVLSERDLQVIKDLKEKGQFYEVPEWCLDDYYWMIGSVVAHTRISPNEKSLPGLRPLLITNDQMRDHKLALLEPRLFRRWTSCHIVRYDYGLYEGDEWLEDRAIFLEHADSFSHEIQANPTPTGTTAWHIPIAEWSEDRPHDRFVISIGAPSS